MRWLACAAVLAVACSNSSPHGAADAPRGDGSPGVDGNAVGDFTVRVTTARPRVPAGGFDSLDVAVTRDAFAGAIDIAIPSPPAGVTATPITLDAGATTGALRLDGDASLVVGSAVALHVVATGAGLSHAVDVTLAVTFVPGSLDPGFGGSGAVSLALGASSRCNDLAIGSDDEITAVGAEIGSGAVSGVVARVLASGSADPSFTPTPINPKPPLQAQFISGALAADGGVFAGGFATDPSTGAAQVPWLARFSPTGGVAFGSDFPRSSATATATAIARTPAGAFEFEIAANGALLVGRQLATGSADSSFDGGALLPLDVAATGGPAAFALDAGGSNAYAVGVAANHPAIDHVAAAGTLDTTFDAAADAALAGLGSAAQAATAVAVQPDGSIVIAGPPGFVVRLHADGSLDTAFGTAGLATTGALASVVAVAVQSDGKLVVAGVENTPRLVRLLPDGALDPSYGAAGVAPVPLDALSALRLQADDDAVACGISANQATLARLTY